MQNLSDFNFKRACGFHFHFVSCRRLITFVEKSSLGVLKSRVQFPPLQVKFQVLSLNTVVVPQVINAARGFIFQASFKSQLLPAAASCCSSHLQSLREHVLVHSVFRLLQQRSKNASCVHRESEMCSAIVRYVISCVGKAVALPLQFAERVSNFFSC
jgi:hypothetical protein